MAINQNTNAIVNGFIKCLKGNFTRPLFSCFHLGPHLNYFNSSCSINNDVDDDDDDKYAFDYYVLSKPFDDKVKDHDEYDYVDALKSFDVMIQTRPLPSVVKFNKSLHVVTRVKCYSSSLHLFKQMYALGVPLNHYTARIVIKCYSHIYQTRQGGFSVLGYCLKQGILPRVSIYNTLLKGFILEDHTHHAETLFYKMFKNKLLLSEPNLITYNTMIKGLCKIGNNFTAIALLRLMDGRDCKPNLVSYNTIIHALCYDLLIDDAFKIFKEMVSKQNIPPNVDTYNSLIYALCKLGRWDDVSTMLKQMMEDDENIISPNLKTSNIFVDALCKEGKVKEAIDTVNIMVKQNPTYYPGIVIYNSLIHGYCLQGEMTKARTMFDTLDSKHVKPNALTYNYLLDGYCKNSMVDEAFSVHISLGNKDVKPKPNRVADYIVRTAQSSDASQCYVKAACKKKMPSRIGYFLMAPPYKHWLKDDERTAFKEALALFHFMDGQELNSDIGVYNILIDRATKRGKFDTARRLFNDLFLNSLQPDIETYTVMVRGLSQGGLLKFAKQLLNKMENTDCPPDQFIFNYLSGGYIKYKPYADAVMLTEELRARPWYNASVRRTFKYYF